MIRRTYISLSLSLLGALMPLFVHAAIFNSLNDVVSKACEVVNILFTGAVILTVVFVLLAGIKYITKGADPKEVANAHQMLIWAAIGFAVAVFAAVFPTFVAGALGTTISDPC